MKKDIIMVPFHDYKKWLEEGFRTRDSHLFEHFKKNEEVDKILVINRPTSLAEMIIKRKGWKTKVGKVILEKEYYAVTEIEKNVYCIDFLLMDFFKVAIQGKKWWYTSFSYKKIQEAIKEAIQFINMSNKILFLENPMAVEIIGKIGENKFAFDAIDNWLYHPQMKKNHELIKKNYKLIEEKADIIFTVSEALMDVFNENKNVVWVPNGVDKEQFETSIIKEKEKRERPVIGYMGKIQDRVDFDLIEKCLQQYSSNQFIIMGPVYAQKDKVKTISQKYENISFTGDIHYQDLPKKMKEIDIAIIPHKVDEFTNSMNPLKVYEYLAAGKQVVTTKVAGSEGISKYVYQSNTDEQFIENIKIAMEQYRETKNISELVIETIKEERFWKNKADRIIKELEKNNDK